MDDQCAGNMSHLLQFNNLHDFVLQKLVAKLSPIGDEGGAALINTAPISQLTTGWEMKSTSFVVLQTHPRPPSSPLISTMLISLLSCSFRGWR